MRDENNARLVHCQRQHPAHARSRRGVVRDDFTRARDGGDGAVPIDLAHSAILHIGNEYVARRVQRQPVGMCEERVPGLTAVAGEVWAAHDSADPPV